MTSPVSLTYLGCSVTCDETPCARCVEWKKQLEAEATGKACFRVREKDVTLESAVAEVRQLLEQSRRPAIFADGHLTSAQGHLLVDLAAKERAILTTQLMSADAEFNAAVARRGASTCTLGEVSQRADVVVFWNVGEAEIAQVGERLGKRDRKVFSIGIDGVHKFAEFPHPASKTQPPSPQGRRIDPVELLTSLQLLLNGKTKEIAPDVLLLAEALLAADYPVMVVGHEDKVWHTPAAMRQLVDVHLALREKKRAFLLSLPRHAVALTVGNVLLSRCGYGDAVDFAAIGGQRVSDLSVEALFKEGEVDLLVVVSDRGNERLEQLVAEAGRKLKVVRISLEVAQGVEVSIATSRLDVASYIIRFDGVPIPVRPSEFSSVSPRLTEILTNLLT